ncbi:MAG: ABC transporter permease [Cyanobacteria bacterium REEB65]|nr:ABC transporter permease [Cyanobacteria bacterium REEB65]
MPDLGEVGSLAAAHVGLTLAAVGLAFAVALPAGIMLTRPPLRPCANAVVAVIGALQTLPSLAIIAFAMVWFGLGFLPALAALALYGVLPILHNTLAGLAGVPADLREAARGLGLSPGQVLWQVELPVARPLILAGLRTATVLTIGTAALAAEIGAPCLGTLIFQGVSTGSIDLILAGAVPTAVLAIAVDLALAGFQRSLLPATDRIEGSSRQA